MKLQDYEKLERRQDRFIGIILMVVILVLTFMFIRVEDRLLAQQERAEAWKRLYHEQIQRQSR